MKNSQLLKYFFLFVIAFLLFSYFQYFPTFPDPDSFYHAKMAVLIRDQGIVRDFPWLEFTVLKNYYIDHHFLYHVLLVPFVSFLDPLAGVKLATTLFAALSIAVFYWFLERFKVCGAFFYSLLLLINYPFIFRINLAKASALAIIILLLGLYFIFKRKYWCLFVLSFFYVWTHAGWPLIFVLTSFYVLGGALIKTPHQISNEKIKNQISKIKKYFYTLYFILYTFIRQTFTKSNIKLLSACFGGLLAGIIINPYFPKNLSFYWYQIIQIAVINYKNKIGVGAEWYPYNFFDLINNASLVFVLLIIGLSGFFIFFLKRNAQQRHCEERSDEAISENFLFTTGLPRSADKSASLAMTKDARKNQILTLFLIFIFFFILTLRSRRNVEYWAPFSILFSAFLINEYLPYKLEELLAKLKNVFVRNKLSTRIISTYFLIIFPFIVGKDLVIVKNSYQNGGPYDKYQGVSEWLIKNTPADSIIFHNDWDDFPPLFYYNTHNRYIAGLDPTFMYDYDKDLHKKWVDITTGKQDNISQIISNDFKSNYVFVDKDHPALENNLKRDGHFKMVYKDSEGKIYQLIK